MSSAVTFPLKVALIYAPDELDEPSELHLVALIALIIGEEYDKTVIDSESVAVLPLESVTVALIVSVPLLLIAPVVNDADVYLLPSAVVDRLLMGEP